MIIDPYVGFKTAWQLTSFSNTSPNIVSVRTGVFMCYLKIHGSSVPVVNLVTSSIFPTGQLFLNM